MDARASGHGVCWRRLRFWWGLVAMWCCVLGGVRPAMAGNPRWTSGPPFFLPPWLAVAWYTTSPLYFTDPGDLSAAVPHAAADRMVANAAAVWNVPTASLVLAQGGELAEHVTGGMVSGSGAGVTMPADVQSTNWQNIPIAVIYDTDGSVIDALLGAGGSDPSGCLQNGVVEDVDLFGQDSTIEHAILILNGRCTGTAPEQQMQMQYQLVRAFGRVLGMGWSQLNDNVFTEVPTPTYAQAQNWPVMHPIDVICGPYTYQCMPSPFTLRADDLSGLAQLYYLWQGQGAGRPGKQDTLQDGSELEGHVYFPNGQGMEGVNVTMRRHPFPSSYVEPWQEVSSVTGYSFRRQAGTVIAPQDGSPMESVGSFDDWREGYWRMERVPIPAGQTLMTYYIDTEPVNPLYTGPYALSTAAASSTTIAPSGSLLHMQSDLAARYYFMSYDQTATDATASCAAGADGTWGAPVPMPASGWWTGALCGYNHSAWTSLAMQPNRTMTVELTALDESGAASTVKTMPLIGVWQASDPQATGPTVAGDPIPFNTGVTGMSAVTISQPASTQLRMTFVDQRGLGRPDFAYQARVLYADSIQPANVGALGGTVVISGAGFRSGMQVLVNGVVGRVTGVTPTTITAVVPSLSQIGGQPTVATVAVLDPATGGSSTMLQALGYGAPGERLQLVSYPSGSVADGQVGAVPFAVRVLEADGVTPRVGESVTLAVTAGSAVLGACGGASCAMVTDGSGVAQTTVTPLSVGLIGLRASTALLTVRASFSAAPPDTIAVVSAPASTATVGLVAGAPFTLRVLAGDGMTPRVGQTVLMTAEGGAAQFTACGAASCALRTDTSGMVSSTVMPLTAGTVVLDASAAAGMTQARFVAAPEQMRLASAPTGLVTAGVALATPFAVRVVGGDGVTPVVGEAVVLSAMGVGVSFGACGGQVCTVMSDATGGVSSSVTVSGAGAVMLTAAARSGSATATFTAGLERMGVVRGPAGAFLDGVAATPAMVVRVLGPDGVTPVAGEAVSFAVTAGRAALGGCGGASCTTVTDGLGEAAMVITPESVGVIRVTATGRGGAVSATLTGLPQPDVLLAVTGFPARVSTGVSTVDAVLRLVQGDGVTPVVGVGVEVSVMEGVGILGACGSSSCTLMTDAGGVVRTTFTPVLAGVVSVLAQASGVATPVSLGTTAVATERTVVSLQPVQYVAEGVTASWTAEVGVSEVLGSAEGLGVVWTGVSGMGFGVGSSAVTSGLAGAEATVRGLGAGVEAEGTACAWGGVCGEVVAEGVSAAAWRMGVVSGGAQTVGGGGAAQAVELRVTDAAGHPVLGVPVTVYQEVVAGQQACGPTGRCPGGEVLRSGSAGMVTDAAGTVRVTPMRVGTGSSVTEMTAVAGTGATASASVIWTP